MTRTALAREAAAIQAQLPPSAPEGGPRVQGRSSRATFISLATTRPPFAPGREAGGWSTLNVAKVCVLQATPRYHTTGEVLDVISTLGLERMARFLAFFVSAVDCAPHERINP